MHFLFVTYLYVVDKMISNKKSFNLPRKCVSGTKKFNMCLKRSKKALNIMELVRLNAYILFYLNENDD